VNAIGKVIGMLVISGALAGFTISLFIPHRYMARAELTFVGKPDVTPASYQADARKLFDSATEITLLPQSIELIIRRSPYFKERLYVESMADILEDVRKNLAIKSFTRDGRSGAQIEFEDDDADTALDVTRDVLSQMGENAARISAVKKATEVVKIVRTPQVNLTGLTPLLLTALGLAAGTLAGLVLWLVAPRSSRENAHLLAAPRGPCAN
jgi:hypothetical protein